MNISVAMHDFVRSEMSRKMKQLVLEVEGHVAQCPLAGDANVREI